MQISLFYFSFFGLYLLYQKKKKKIEKNKYIIKISFKKIR